MRTVIAAGAVGLVTLMEGDGAVEQVQGLNLKRRLALRMDSDDDEEVSGHLGMGDSDPAAWRRGRQKRDRRGAGSADSFDMLDDALEVSSGAFNMLDDAFGANAKRQRGEKPSTAKAEKGDEKAEGGDEKAERGDEDAGSSSMADLHQPIRSGTPPPSERQVRIGEGQNAPGAPRPHRLILQTGSAADHVVSTAAASAEARLTPTGVLLRSQGALEEEEEAEEK